MFSSDRYLITECLSDAGWYRVYRASCRQRRCEVVLKYLADSYPDAAMLAAMRSEYRLLQALDVPAVIKVLALEEQGRQLVLVREYVPGLSLGDDSASRAMALPEVCKWILSLAETLHAVHAAGRVHGNLSPRNVLVEPAQNTLKLIGFGRTQYQLASKSSPVGDADYLAPEQCGRLDREVDSRSDIYALGVMFFELLTGRKPFVSDDAVGLLHRHIAQPVPDPREFVPELPGIVTPILARMLAKDPDQRYASALELISDIKICRRALDAGISSRPVSIRAVSSLPDRLYGRDAELERLAYAYRKAIGDKAVLCLIGGGSGIGKSSLIEAFSRQILPKQARFLVAKCDQYQGNPPARIFHDAFKGLLQQLLGEEQETLSAWRDRMRLRLGDDARALIEILPELALLLENQTPLPELPAAEAKLRLLRVWTDFVSLVCEPDRPLCLFLDDLQWADPALFPWLECLLSGAKHLLLIAAFRDADIDADHALLRTADKLRADGVHVEKLALSALPLSALSAMVAELLAADQETATVISRALYDRTQGNPYFFIQFLRQLQLDGYLAYHADSGRWSCDAERMRTLGISDNVVELMVARIATLDGPLRELLKLAACIGSVFDAGWLDAVAEANGRSLALLAEAEAHGLLLRKSGGQNEYAFSHDRVQQAARSLLTADQVQAHRLKIGRYLRSHAHSHHDRLALFQAVEHLNAAQASIDEEYERRLLGADNFRVGLWAKHGGAFEQALPYLRQASALLASRLAQFGGRATVLGHLAECEHLCGFHDQAEQLFEQAAGCAASELEKARVFEMMIQFHADLSQFEQAYRVSRRAAALFGIDLPAGFNPLQFGIEFLALKSRLRRFRVEQLMDLPAVTDTRMNVAIRLLSATLKVAYQIRPELCVAIAVKQVDRCLRHGNNAEAVIGYMVFGVIFLGGVLGDHDAGYRYGRLSLGLLDKYANHRQRAEVNFVYGYFAHSWRFPAQDTENYWQTALVKGLQSGDWFHSGCAVAGLAQSRFMRGVPLEQLWQDTAEMQAALAPLDAREHLHVVRGIRQAIENLRGHTLSSDSFDSGDFDEQAYAEGLAGYGSRHFAHYYFVNKMACLYLQGEYQKAWQVGRFSERYLKDSAGMLHAAEHHFYSALVLAKRYPELSWLDRYTALQRLRRTEKRLARWAKECPQNFASRRYLVKGEIERLLGHSAHALEAYIRAGSEAEAAGHLHLEALANELAGLQYRATGFTRPARFHFDEAAYCYRRWGAIACLSRLENRIGQAVNANTLPAAALDSVTLVKAAEAIASERRLPQLLQTLMHIVIENAGAQRGALLLMENGDLLIQAQAEFGGQSLTVMQGLPLTAAGDWPKTVINFVARSRETVVLENAQRSSVYGREPEITRLGVRSVLCAPLLIRGELQGVLYLENNVADAVFTAERLYLLQHLSGQIAISIDNAQGYRLLEDKVSERTAHIETQKRALEQKNAELRAHNETIRALNGRLLDENRERRQAEIALQKANAELKNLAMLDGLTQIANRRRFDECLEIECQRLLRDKTPLSLILCDIDYFKAYNDRYGHQAGDDCLKSVAQAIAGALRRPTDMAARYGGEEFAVIMPHTDEQGAAQVANLIRQAVIDLDIRHRGSEIADVVTISIGIAGVMPFHRCTPASLIRTADEALYQVKSRGRNGIQWKNVA